MGALSIASAVLAGIVIGTSILSEPPLDRSFRIYIDKRSPARPRLAMCSKPSAWGTCAQGWPLQSQQTLRASAREGGGHSVADLSAHFVYRFGIEGIVRRETL